MPKRKSHVVTPVVYTPIQKMVTCSLLAAMSIVCGKVLQIPVGEMLRFSFENLPILFAGMLFGPVTGALVGAVADLIGCLLVGYTINPLVTCGAAAIGLAAGLLFRLSARLPLRGRLALSVALPHLVGSVVIKTFGLSQFYDMPFMILMLWRLINYTLVGALELLLLLAIVKNSEMRRMLEPIHPGGNGDAP